MVHFYAMINLETARGLKSKHMYVDAHAHLVDLDKTTISQLLSDSVNVLPVNSAYSYETSLSVLDISREFGPFPNVVGNSPLKFQNVALENESKFQNEYDKWKSFFDKNINSISAIGEIGLDYHWGKSDLEKKRQHIGFNMMLDFAEIYHKPVVIHSRDCIGDILDILETRNMKKVMFHFFSGNKSEAGRIRDNGWIISIPPLRSKKRKQSIKETGINYLVSETDCPYIGKNPEYVINSIKYITETLNMNEEYVMDKILENSVRFFDLSINNNI